MAVNLYVLLSTGEAYVAVMEFPVRRTLPTCLSLRSAALDIDIDDEIRSCWEFGSFHYYLGTRLNKFAEIKYFTTKVFSLNLTHAGIAGDGDSTKLKGGPLQTVKKCTQETWF